MFHPRQKKAPLLGAVDVPCPTSAPNPPTAAAALPFAPPPGKRRALGDLLGHLKHLKTQALDLWLLRFDTSRKLQENVTCPAEVPEPQSHLSSLLAINT